MQQRAFEKRSDVTRLQAFLVEMLGQGAQSGTFLFGDLMYEMHHPYTGFDEYADIRIWECDGSVCGFVFFVPPNVPELFIRPELCGSPAGDEMISWALRRATEPRTSEVWGEDQTADSIEISCLDSDAAKAGFLKRHGFTRYAEEDCVLLERPLSEPLPECPLPEAYSVVTIAEHPELACGIPNSGMEREEYRRVLSAPGYRASLDVRAFFQGTELVSGCTCWYDDLGGYGEFQPVSTKKGHRRKGLASAVLIKAMENLIHCGADRALVWTGKALTHAVSLYESVGFHIIHEVCVWRRRVASE